MKESLSPVRPPNQFNDFHNLVVNVCIPEGHSLCGQYLLHGSELVVNICTPQECGPAGAVHSNNIYSGKYLSLLEVCHKSLSVFCLFVAAPIVNEHICAMSSLGFLSCYV